MASRPPETPGASGLIDARSRYLRSRARRATPQGLGEFAELRPTLITRSSMVQRNPTPDASAEHHTRRNQSALL